MSASDIAVLLSGVLALMAATFGAVHWFRQRRTLQEEEKRLREFEAAIASLKKLIEPSEAYREKQSSADKRD